MGFKDWLGFKLVGDNWQKMNEVLQLHLNEIGRLTDIISIKNNVIAYLERDNNDLRLEIGKKKLYGIKTTTGKKKCGHGSLHCTCQDSFTYLRDISSTPAFKDLKEEESWGDQDAH